MLEKQDPREPALLDKTRPTPLRKKEKRLLQAGSAN